MSDDPIINVLKRGFRDHTKEQRKRIFGVWFGLMIANAIFYLLVRDGAGAFAACYWQTISLALAAWKIGYV